MYFPKTHTHNHSSELHLPTSTCLNEIRRYFVLEFDGLVSTEESLAASRPRLECDWSGFGGRMEPLSLQTNWEHAWAANIA